MTPFTSNVLVLGLMVSVSCMAFAALWGLIAHFASQNKGEKRTVRTFSIWRAPDYDAELLRVVEDARRARDRVL